VESDFYWNYSGECFGMAELHTRQQRVDVEVEGRREAGKRQIDAVTTGAGKWMTHHFDPSTLLLQRKRETPLFIHPTDSLDLYLVQP
jgi:hypothetical protein